ncbi:MAG: polysaccharide biosynthesis/export family protein [Cyclobacteriaceae bacterium]|nr:polysaccharide biosynthesis/export family protein [Cyclobacteriaceae bacterium]
MAVSLSSCVTNRKYVYLQKDDVNVKDLPKDTVVRRYDLPEFEYRLQPEDIIHVRFESLTPEEYDFFNRSAVNMNWGGQLAMGAAQLIGELIDPDGNITYPVIGKVKVAGLTVYEAQEKLQQIAEQYLKSPVVRVRLINFRFTILGEVRQEGTVTLGNNRVSVVEAIGLAGGLTDLADKQNVKLIRQRNGKAEVQYLNLLEESLLHSPEYYLNQNDILIVPALRQRPYQTYLGKNLSLLISSISLVITTITLVRLSNNP